MVNYKLTTILNLSHNIKEEWCHTTEEIVSKENDKELNFTDFEGIAIESDEYLKYDENIKTGTSARINILNEIDTCAEDEGVIEYIDETDIDDEEPDITDCIEIENASKTEEHILEDEHNFDDYADRIVINADRMVINADKEPLGDICKIATVNISIRSVNKNSEIDQDSNKTKGTGAHRQCEECGRTFSRKSTLIQHQTTHTGVKNFSCAECQAMFTRKSHLQIHMRIHNNIKPYVCEVCSRGFVKSSDLLRHRRIHSDDRNFECKLCAKRFKRSNDVLTHMRSHTGVKPYKCNHCDKSYASHSSLKKHMLSQRRMNIIDEMP